MVLRILHQYKVFFLIKEILQSPMYCSTLRDSSMIPSLPALPTCFHELSVYVNTCTALNINSAWHIHFIFTSLFIDLISCNFYIGNCVYLGKNPKQKS